MADGLNIRILGRGDAPQERSVPRVQLNAPAERADTGAGLGARVREALCCPYCRESLTPEELDANLAPETKPDRPAPYTKPVDLLVWFSLSAAGLAGALASVDKSQIAIATAVFLGPLLFLAIRNLAAGVLARYDLQDLFKEARELLRTKQTQLNEHAESAVLGCARPGCGAVYHRECWEECSTSYGACAVFACGSTEAHGLSQTQLRLRGLRLLLAAFLFPQRLVDAVRTVDPDSNDGELVRLRAAIRERAGATHTNLWTSSNDQQKSIWTSLFTALQLGTVVGGALLGGAAGFWLSNGNSDEKVTYGLTGTVLVPALFAVLLYSSSWFFALGLYAAKSLLSSEFSALSRLGQGGAYLSRASSNKK